MSATPDPVSVELRELLAKLRAKRDSGQRTVGGGSVAIDGLGIAHTKTWGNEPIMVLANPDGPKAADAIESLLDTLAASQKRIEAVLTPFATWAEHIDAMSDETIMYASVRPRDGHRVAITVGDLRAALALSRKGV